MNGARARGGDDRKTEKPTQSETYKRVDRMDVIEREKTNEVRVTNNACVGVVCINVRA